MIKRESGPYYTAYDLLQERDSKGIPPISFKFRAICSYNRLDIDLSYRIEEFFINQQPTFHPLPLSHPSFYIRKVFHGLVKIVCLVKGLRSSGGHIKTRDTIRRKTKRGFCCFSGSRNRQTCRIARRRRGSSVVVEESAAQKEKGKEKKEEEEHTKAIKGGSGGGSTRGSGAPVLATGTNHPFLPQDVVRQSIPVFAAHPLSKQLGTLLGHRVQSSRCAQALAGRGRVRRVLSRASALGTEQTVAAVAGGPGRLDQ